MLALISCGDEQGEVLKEPEAIYGAEVGAELILNGTTFKSEYQNLELVGFYLHEDRNLVSEGGRKTSEADFMKTIELARKHPPQFLVEFILFPDLVSNNDLRLIRRWCSLCDKQDIPWFIHIRPESSKPLRFLYRNPPADAPESEF